MESLTCRKTNQLGVGAERFPADAIAEGRERSRQIGRGGTRMSRVAGTHFLFDFGLKTDIVPFTTVLRVAMRTRFAKK